MDITDRNIKRILIAFLVVLVAIPMIQCIPQIPFLKSIFDKYMLQTVTIRKESGETKEQYRGNLCVEKDKDKNSITIKFKDRDGAISEKTLYPGANDSVLVEDGLKEE